MDAAQNGKGGVFFLYGYGGTGKTFVWKTLAAALRSKSQVVLTVASSGIASLLLPGGRTTHSRFSIPLNLDEFSTCNIRQGSALAELLIKTKLIIWDEAPMVNRFCIEALDRTMRDILRFKNPNSLHQPFGGKTVVFGGDFRQILPVIPKRTRQEIVNATINSSYIWNECPTESNNDLLASIHTPEFLNTIRCSGVPNHELTLKIGTPIMLLRNIDHSAGLCNGTRLVVTKIEKHIIEARGSAGKNKGQKVFIPKMTLSPSDHRIPFKFQRRQFPIMVSYTMTINKSQGQSLANVGLILKKLVFTHGQLYVAASRVTHRGGLKILLCHDEDNCAETDNVVFKEVFRNVA
ncbi:uncharacterized protein LOC107469337 [Arachis duranensis]|uniref:ATP-dependent DNA helicase n=1 Tax=Arachis duranensis TaxID=130453 RepID=A0A9C6WMM4_ARADU|nr:uncharacterized protein LOC107469337 [Arachis duranensis]